MKPYAIVVTSVDIVDGYVDNRLLCGKEKGKEYFDQVKKLAIEKYGESDTEETDAWDEFKEIYFRIGDKYEQFMRKENIY